ncbi:hypothetical protein LVD13_04805 [Flavobacteriaceae bacterium D16]|nr:hypothetical protein [Flavobacteriaceae bacterium D16]
MNLKKFYRELLRRNTLKAILAYLAVSWLVVQVASIVLPLFESPPYVLKGLIYLLGVGLIIWTGFSWVYDLTPEGIQKTPEEGDTAETRNVANRRLNAVIAGAAIAALLVLMGGSFWAGSRWNKADDLVYKPTYRIAVLPLNTNTADSEEMEILKNGLTDGLIGALSSNNSIMVLSMASTQHFTAGVVPENEYLRSELEHIDYFITGSFDKTANLIKVSINLHNELTNDPFWMGDYTQDISENKQLWNDIAGDIREVLGLEKDNQTSVVKRNLRSIRPETYELYLKGKYYLSKSTIEDWKKGLLYLQEAIDRNPADADAYAGMAEGYIYWGHSLNPPEDVNSKALAAAKRAIQLDSTNAEGWAALAHYHTYYGWDWEMADYAFKKADSLNPNMAYNHYHRAWFLELFGKMDRAIKEHKKAQELDPFSPVHTAWLAELYRRSGEYDLALEELQKVFDMSRGGDGTALTIKGMVLANQGKVEEGLESMKQATEINEFWKVMYGPSLLRAGRKQEAHEILEEFKNMPDTPFFNLAMANMYRYDGDLDKMFACLEKGKKHAWYPWAVQDLRTEHNIQDDPRLLGLIRELQLPSPGAISQ